MASSNIIVDLKYHKAQNLKYRLNKWAEYVCDPKKCDPRSIDEYNVLQDSIYYSDKETFLTDEDETYAWAYNGDIDVKKDVKNQKLEASGMIWKLMISFPPDFAIDNGLISKIDFYQLTLNILPTLFADAGLDINNINWYSALHRNTKNPHMHIAFYQKRNIYDKSILSDSSIYKLKSKIANYLINNIDFYKTRDTEFKDIIGTISYKDFTRIRSEKIFSIGYRNELNRRLLALYDKLPTSGRLQYNSDNMKPYKKELDSIIEYILSHDSVIYKFADYEVLLQKQQQKLTEMYGESKDNKNKKYYHDQINKLYSKIGNEVLNGFKIYQSKEVMEREKSFLVKNINNLNFKSRSDYAKDSTKIDIAKGLYKICIMADLNYIQTKKVFKRWSLKSNYDFDIDALLSTFSGIKSDMTSTEYYNNLKRLGYSYDKYKKVKDKNFYKELNYKVFINRAINHVLYELEQEDKSLLEDMKYNLEVY